MRVNLHIFNSLRQPKNQRGIASIIVVSVLVILLSLVSIGFSRLVNRDASSALEDQKARIASYAAESGVNQVINYINTSAKLPSNLSKCQNNLLKKLNSTTGLSGDKSTEYTCILLNLNPTDLSYVLPQPQQSKTIKLSASAPLTSAFISWASSNNGVPVPSASQDLLDEATWNKRDYMPLLRVSVYALPPNNQLSGPGYLAKTVFLYPSKNSGSNVLDLTGAQAVADGALVPINCQAQSFNNFSYVSPGTQYCSAIFDNPPPGGDSTFYLRVTPIYGAARIDIRAQTAGGDVTFRYSQAVIDVTAKSTDVVKRLQARVELTGQGQPAFDNLPEYALQSAGTICKRFVVPGGGTPFIDPGSVKDCGSPVVCQCQQLPPVAITKPATSISANGATLNGTVRPNAPAATYYYEYAPGPTHVQGESLTKVPAKPAPMTIDNGTTFDYPEPTNLVASLTPNLPYHFHICGDNGLTNCGQWLTFVYQPNCTSNCGGGGGCTNICMTIKNYSCSQEPMPAFITAYGPGVPAPGKTVWNGFYTTLHCIAPIPYFYDKVDMSNFGFTSNKGIVLVVHSLGYGPPYAQRSGDIYSVTITQPGQPQTSTSFSYDNPSTCDTKWGPCPTPYPVRVNRNGNGTATSKPTH